MIIKPNPLTHLLLFLAVVSAVGCGEFNNSEIKPRNSTRFSYEHIGGLPLDLYCDKQTGIEYLVASGGGIVATGVTECK